MQEKPILFSDSMVRIMLAGKKSMTRRVLKAKNIFRYYPPDRYWVGPCPNGGFWAMNNPDGPDEKQIAACIRDGFKGFPCPYGATGDRLWVKETYTCYPSRECSQKLTLEYRAGGIRLYGGHANYPHQKYGVWRSPIFMPRDASRITLEITGVRVEPLQAISEEDCVSELGPDSAPALRECFRHLWDDLNAQRGFGWTANPWVWVLSFRLADINTEGH